MKRTIQSIGMSLFTVLSSTLIAFASALVFAQESAAQVPFPVDCSTYPIVTLHAGNYSAADIAADKRKIPSFARAVELGESALDRCNDEKKTVIIRLHAGAKEMLLPPEIGTKDNGTIKIIGDDDAGVIGTIHNQPTVHRVKLELEKLKFAVTGNSRLIPEANLRIKDSLFTRGENKAVVIVPSSKTTRPFTVIVEQSKFANIGILRADENVKHIRLFKNEVRFTTGVTDPAVDLSPVSSSEYEAIIRNNSFSYSEQVARAQSIRIARPNVKVIGNRFAGDSAKNMTTGVEILALGASNISGVDVAMVENILIQWNTFSVFRSIGNDQQSGPSKDQLGRIEFSFNDLSKAPTTLPIATTYMNHTKTFGPCNYWGDNNKRADVKAVPGSMDRVLASPPVEGDTSCMPTRFGGETRVETAVDLSKEQYPNGAEGVIIARTDVAADSVSAVPFAKIMNMPVLLTPPDSLHPATEAEIRRLMPTGGIAYVMGREVAIHPDVEAKIKAIVGKTERIAGANRAHTAVETAGKLEGMGKMKHVMVTDGADWQPDLLAGPAAAIKEGATLLTWGDKVAPETKAYINAHPGVPVTALGSKAVKAGVTADGIDEANPTALGMKIIQRFFSEPKTVGFATTQDFADALTGGAHMAGLYGPLLLIDSTTPPEVLTWVKNTTSLNRIVIYGGTARISEEQEAALREALAH